MGETIAKLLERLGGQPRRFERLREMLNSLQLRAQYNDYAEEIAQRETAGYDAIMRERTEFYAELLQREGERLYASGQVEAQGMIIEHLAGILQALEHTIAAEDIELLGKCSKYILNAILIKGDLRLGLTLCEKILPLVRQAGNNLITSSLKNAYGVFLVFSGRHEEALQALNIALELASNEGDKRLEADAIKSLAILARRECRYEDAIALNERCLVLFKALDDRWATAGVLCNLGVVAHYQYHLDDAWRYYSESLEISRELGNIHWAMNAVNNLCAIAIVRDDYTAAMSLLEEARRLSSLLGNIGQEAGNLLFEGNIALNTGQWAKASNSYKKALVLARQCGDYPLAAACEGNLAGLCLRKGRLDKAEQHVMACLRLSQEAGTLEGISVAHIRLSSYYYYMGDCVQSKACAKQSLQVIRQIRRIEFEADALNQLALLSAIGQDYVEASRLASEALQLRLKAGSRFGVLDALQTCVQILAGAGRHSVAALLAHGIYQATAALGLAYGAVWDRELAMALAKAAAQLTAVELKELQTKADGMSVQQLAEHALAALTQLQAEMGWQDSAPQPATAD